MSDATASSPRIKIPWLIGTLAAFALFALIAAYSARMTGDYVDYDQQRAAQRYETLGKVRHAEEALLTPVDSQGHPTAEWVDQAKGVVRIPIEEAMVREIDTLKTQPAQAGAAIAAAPPAPANPGPAVSGTNAAPAKPAKPNPPQPASASAATTTPPAKPNATNE